MKKVYLSGPISSLNKNTAHTNFLNAETDAKKSAFYPEGIEVINPMDTPEQSSWEDYMRYSIKRLMDCHYILMLNGWKSSRGACIERALAFELGIHIDYEDYLREYGLV